jgi:hypothetical protein
LRDLSRPRHDRDGHVLLSRAACALDTCDETFDRSSDLVEGSA